MPQRYVLLTALSACIAFGFTLAASAQTFSVSQVRAELHDRLRAGHVALPYSQTDEAMERIHTDQGVPGNLILFYTRRSQDSDDWVSGNAQNGWNREHLWPQSRGAGSLPMKSDLFHLMPTDASVNQSRGNLNFEDGGVPEGEAQETFLDADSFEPADVIKGDVARSMFYMDLRYEGTNGEPDLILQDGTTNSGSIDIGDLCTLLDWHLQDRVDDAERARNDATEAEQGNRNVFIDEPDLAEVIYGQDCGRADGAFTTASSDSDSGESLRIGTWNIANLHHETGAALRTSSLPRDDQDYQRLAAVAASLDLDIGALQEVGSPSAVARVFPPDRYHIIMSDRYQPGAEDAPADQRRIYTALVFAKDRFPSQPPISTFEALGIDHVGFDRDGTPSARPTRAGVTADLIIGGEPLRLMNVHLKSSCHRWNLSPVQDQSSTNKPFRTRFDCRTLDAQLNILESWVEQQAAQGITTIVLGDFNRDMNATNASGDPIDGFWLALNDGAPNGLELSKGPLGSDEVCWPNHSDRFVDHIDFVVYDRALNDLANIGEPVKLSMGHEDDPKYETVPHPTDSNRKVRNKQKLSDHCPVVMEIRY